MRYLIEKISSYNIFNYLLPGVLFAAFGEKLTSYELIHQNWLIGLFLYYFAGLCISRVGSLAIEPTLRRARFLRFVDYKDYVKASASDPRIEILSEQNNMYRTLCSLFLLLSMLKIYNLMGGPLPWHNSIAGFILLIGLFVLSLLSYRKSTQYVVRRVDEVEKVERQEIE